MVWGSYRSLSLIASPIRVRKEAARLSAETEDGIGGDGKEDRKGSDSLGDRRVNGLGRWSMFAKQP